MDWTRELPELKGSRITRAFVGQENGYDMLVVLLDGIPHGFTMREAGQAGWCEFALGTHKFERIMNMQEE